MITTGIRTSPNIVKRAGLFVAMLALSAGIVTAGTSWATAETARSQSQAAATEIPTYPRQFDAKLSTALTTLASNPADAPVSAAFYKSYVGASQAYAVALLNAAQVYAGTYTTNPGAARDVYIDSFNHAGDAYFNQLEGARNTVVGELSGKDDVAKDMFVNEYNAARDVYRNQIEGVKNAISAL